MADHRRADRVGEAIRMEVATFLREGAKDPRLVGMVTITAVEVPRDLRHARIFVSILGTDSERAATLDALESMKGHLRSRLARTMQLRVAPELSFKLDQSVARAARIESLLAQVRDEKKSGDEGTSD
ncbi:MAG TPA: 30S ribosome-binding factor RbfA [Gemmatimonadaceae bacterium]|nr:30S ribosome-binding factor RbfA [Gemmatimonadaceae bacterium]